MRKIDWAIVSNQSKFISRIDLVSGQFGYHQQNFNSIDNFAEIADTLGEIPLILIDAEKIEKESDIAGMVQVAKQMTESSHILVSISGKMEPSSAAFLKKSGANVVLIGGELETSSKLEFFASQKIRSSFYPIKANEIPQDIKLEIPVYHLMPLNRKFLPVIRAGEIVTQEKTSKISTAGELYIRRDDIDIWKKHCEANAENSSTTLSKRSRAKFLSLMNTYSDLVMLISDQSEFASYEAGNNLLKKCRELSSDLLATLGSTGNAWEIVNNSAIGEFGSLERAPAVAAYAGLFSLMSGVGSPEKVMLGALLTNLALIDLLPGITKKIRDSGGISSLNSEEMEQYKLHPKASLNKVLNRKFQIEEDIKSIIEFTHERFDKKGFPSQPRPEKIPEESNIIQLCEEIDNRSLVTMGKEKKSISAIKSDLLSELEKDSGRFSILFITSARAVFSKI